MRKLFLNPILLIAFLTVFIISCRKERTPSQLTTNENVSIITNNSVVYGKSGKKIKVSTVTELYDAVNNSDNEGALIELEGGTYTLIPNYPNSFYSGRLELQRDMKLQGQPGHPDSVVIDASDLPPGSFTPPVIPGAPVRTGAIRMGKGYNSIEWLTVIGNSDLNALSVIDTDLDSDTAHVRIAHLIVTGGQLAIDIRNGGSNNTGRVLVAEISDNELFNNRIGGGNGISIQNSVGANGAIIHATLNNNYAHDNIVGIRAWNQHTNFGKITIQSVNDRFDGNSMGILLSAGYNSTAALATTSNGNFLSFEAHASSIRNNVRLPLPISAPPAGIYIAGGFTLNVPNRTSNNLLEMKLWGCQISGNQGVFPINAFGAHSLSVGIPGTNNIAGTNNIVNISLFGVSNNVAVGETDSFPTEPAGTNILNVFR